jgi:hypothetical protein
MSHPLLSAFKADLRAMIGAEGQSVTWTPYGGEAEALDGLFAPLDEPPSWAGAYGYDDADYASLILHSDDPASAPGRDDSAVVDGSTWTARHVRAIMLGAGWQILLSRDEGVL